MSSQHSDFEWNSALSKTLHVMCLCPSGWNSKHSRSKLVERFLWNSAADESVCHKQRKQREWWHATGIQGWFVLCLKCVRRTNLFSGILSPSDSSNLMGCLWLHTVVWQILCSRRYRLLRHSKERQRLDGLNNLNYSPLVSRRTLYTNITVTLSRKLAPVANYWHQQNWTATYPGIKVLWD